MQNLLLKLNFAIKNAFKIDTQTNIQKDGCVTNSKIILKRKTKKYYICLLRIIPKGSLVIHLLLNTYFLCNLHMQR